MQKKGVMIQMELLNSKVDHQDYMCDNSNWGFELCQKNNSDNFKLLYDIYHMQISEGDIIRTISKNYHFIGHYHTAGVLVEMKLIKLKIVLPCNNENNIINWI